MPKPISRFKLWILRLLLRGIIRTSELNLVQVLCTINEEMDLCFREDSIDSREVFMFKCMRAANIRCRPAPYKIDLVSISDYEIVRRADSYDVIGRDHICVGSNMLYGCFPTHTKAYGHVLKLMGICPECRLL